MSAPLLECHLARYGAEARAALEVLAGMWTDLDYGPAESRHDFELVAGRALECWAAAKREVEGRRDALLAQLHETEGETLSIQGRLGVLPGDDQSKVRPTRSCPLPCAAGWQVVLAPGAGYCAAGRRGEAQLSREAPRPRRCHPR